MGEDRQADDERRIAAKRLTIEDVGRLAGVSRNTVSLALANSPRVRPATRERVIQVVQSTGYRPNHAAAVLAGGLTKTLGVVEFGLPAYLSDRAYLGYLAGIEEATSANGYDLLLLSAHRMPESDRLLALARARRVDGLVLLGPETDRTAVAGLLAAGVPMVHIGRRVIPGQDLAYVTPDYGLAGKQALLRLVRRGSRRIVYVTGVNQPESKSDLWESIVDAARQHAARGRVLSTAACDLRDVGDLPFAQNDRSDFGIVVHGSRTCTALWRILTELGMRARIVAYDDEGWLDEALPSLDLIRPRKRCIGHTAALLALDLIANKKPLHPHMTVASETSWEETPES